MITIGIFTTTRAEFGIFTPFIEQLKNSSKFDYKLYVGGTHLRNEHGNTINEIKNSGFIIDKEFDYLNDDNTLEGITKSVSKATHQLASIFKDDKFDFACVLGDRIELLSIVQTALIFNKPIIHIHGGELTHGAIDEQVRHMITKSANIHFVSCESYYDNIRGMGEQDWRIFNTGALAVENIQRLLKYDKLTLCKSLGLDATKETVLMTYHPTTLELNISAQEQIQNLFKALDSFDFQVLITAPNMDAENEVIMNEIQKHIDHKKYHFVHSLGVKKYLNILQHTKFVIGNSSSGILEVPYFRIPTINIGSRQDGRLRHESIIDTNYDEQSIINSIEIAITEEFQSKIKEMSYQFGEGQTSLKMTKAILEVAKRSDLLIKKLDFPC
jgi:GDP/UDP-N,N'-diacetylbacillosamine 2-epimerase (hydrolysing)